MYIVITYFSVCKVPVDLLWLHQEIDHLPQSKLEIHLPEVENPPEILKHSTCMAALILSRVAHSNPAGQRLFCCIWIPYSNTVLCLLAEE